MTLPDPSNLPPAEEPTGTTTGADTPVWACSRTDHHRPHVWEDRAEPLDRFPQYFCTGVE